MIKRIILLSFSSVLFGQEVDSVAVDTTAAAPKIESVLQDTTQTPLPDIRPLKEKADNCLLYTSPSPRDGLLSRMPSSA